jgi:hypothetical protein
VNKISFIVLSLFSLSLSAQQFCYPNYIPFTSGEQVIYDVEYKMGKSWVSAGKVRFLVKDSSYNNQPAYYIEGKGKSLKNYDWFFKVRDKYASFISKDNLKPIHFIRRVREGEFSLNYDYDFNYKNLSSTVLEKRKKEIKYDTIQLTNCSYDIMSSVYLSRSIDFESLSINDSVTIDIILDKEIYNNVAIIYKGVKKVTDQNGKQINCIHFQLDLIEGTIFKGNEKMDVFVSNDENKVPIYIEAEIIVGSVRVYAKSIIGTKTPLKYLN